MRVLIAFLLAIFLMSAVTGANLHTLNYSQRNTPVAVGEIAPDFTLEDQNRHKVTLSDNRDKSNVLLVFYRGYW
jgi:cytochrome oxidase Cu insertion factor (SCO1/SenC/PrrC family)